MAELIFLGIFDTLVMVHLQLLTLTFLCSKGRLMNVFSVRLSF